MPEQANLTTATVEIAVKPGREEYRLPLLINRLENDPSVADVEWVDRPTVADEGQDGPQDGDSA